MRLLVIGPHGVGKTTLIRALMGIQGKAPKTQMIEVMGEYIDTPGEYLELPRFYRALLVSAQQADLVLWVAAADKTGIHLPPGFARSFCRPVIGVINKIDVPGANIKSASEALAQAGVEEPYHFVSAVTGAGLNELWARFKTFTS